MLRKIRLPMAICAALMLGATFASSAQAGSASRTWVGPNGGAVHWNGYRAPGYYRGAVTVTTPDGRVYRRVTKGRRGPYGAYYSRRWVGPNGVYYRRGAVRY